MGIEYKAVIVAGLHYSCFPDKEQLEDLVHDGDLDRFAPYYDAPNEDCLFGILVDSSGGSYAPLPALIQVDELRQFKEITGVPGTLYLSLKVS